MKYANWLKKMRVKHGFTQEEIADCIGVTRNTVSKYENARARPSNETIKKLFEIYKCSNEEKLDYIDPPTRLSA